MSYTPDPLAIVMSNPYDHRDSQYEKYEKHLLEERRYQEETRRRQEMERARI